LTPLVINHILPLLYNTFIAENSLQLLPVFFIILCLFCVFGVFSPVCLELSVSVQVIPWKDSSLKSEMTCYVLSRT